MTEVPVADHMAMLLHVSGALCQITTAFIAAIIGILTFQNNRRQNHLSLINQNNTLANLVNTTVIHSPEARDAIGNLRDCVVGCPDDAILFMYLNYVHNTYRTYRIGAVGRQVWLDTLGSCAVTISRLQRNQVERLLERGYEAAFRQAVLARFDALMPQPEAAPDLSAERGLVAPFPPRHSRRPGLALAG